MPEPLEVIAYHLSTKALDKQDAAVSELRARTGTLLAASSIVASFLGATAIDRDGVSPWSVVALLALGVSLALCVSILLPRDRMGFSVNGAEAYEELYAWRNDPLEVHRRLTYALGRQHATNEVVERRLIAMFRLAAIVFGLQLVLWALALAVA